MMSSQALKPPNMIPPTRSFHATTLYLYITPFHFLYSHLLGSELYTSYERFSQWSTHFIEIWQTRAGDLPLAEALQLTRVSTILWTPFFPEGSYATMIILKTRLGELPK